MTRRDDCERSGEVLAGPALETRCRAVPGQHNEQIDEINYALEPSQIVNGGQRNIHQSGPPLYRSQASIETRQPARAAPSSQLSPAMSSDAPTLAIDSGHTAWMLVSMALVQLMLPGLAFFCAAAEAAAPGPAAASDSEENEPLSKRSRAAAGPSQAASPTPAPASSRKRKEPESGDARAEVDLTGLSSEASGMARAIDARYKSDEEADPIPALALLKDLANYVPEGGLAKTLDGIERAGAKVRKSLSEAFGAINKRNGNAIMHLDEDNKTWYASTDELP